MPSATDSLVEKTKNRFRSRPLQAAAGALALLTITYSIYSWSIGNGDRGRGGGTGPGAAGSSSERNRESDGNDPEPSGKDPKSKSAQRNLNRPTLSLSFPPSFDSTDPNNLSHLKTILNVLSTSFAINLIVPIPSIRSHLEPQDQMGEKQVDEEEGDDLFENLEASTNPKSDALDSTNLTLESIEDLAFELSKVAHFDTRRILEYSSDKGRAALSRSLKSDAHVEVLLSSSSDSLDSDEISQVESSRGKRRSELKETRLKEYKPLLELLRKSSGLVVFLVLPSPSLDPASSSKGKFIEDRSELDLSTEAVLGPFGSGVHVPGIRVFDLRERSVPGRRSSRSSNGKTSSGDRDSRNENEIRGEDQVFIGEEEESESMEAWREGADRIKALRSGWK